MQDIWIPVCSSQDLVDGGRGIRFPLTVAGENGVGFAIRYQGLARGYLNRCAHVPSELDWNEGNFFDASSRFLMCATHGALYAADTGFCVGGPCRGRGLRQVTVKESEGQVLWQPDDYLRPARA